MNDRQSALVWSWLGPSLLFFGISQWFAMVSPSHDGLLGWPMVPGGNAPSKAYWGALLSAIGLAVLAHVGIVWARSQRIGIPWWHRVPRFLPLESDDTYPRMPAAAKVGLLAFILLPLVCVGVMIRWVLVAPLVRWASENNVREGGFALAQHGSEVAGMFPFDRLASIGEECAYWKLQCYRLGDLNGIEYKPVLTDGVLLGVLLWASVALVRFAALLWTLPARRR